MKTTEVTREYLEQWLRRLTMSWMKKDFDLVGKLFAKCEYYVEAPFVQPGMTVADIIQFWQEIKQHSDVHVSYDIISIVDGRAVVNYASEYYNGRVHQLSNGIYIIDFDATGECVRFRQWSVVKVIP